MKAHHHAALKRDESKAREWTAMPIRLISRPQTQTTRAPFCVRFPLFYFTLARTRASFSAASALLSAIVALLLLLACWHFTTTKQISGRSGRQNGSIAGHLLNIVIWLDVYRRVLTFRCAPPHQTHLYTKNKKWEKNRQSQHKTTKNTAISWNQPTPTLAGWDTWFLRWPLAFAFLYSSKGGPGGIPQRKNCQIRE